MIAEIYTYEKELYKSWSLSEGRQRVNAEDIYGLNDASIATEDESTRTEQTLMREVEIMRRHTRRENEEMKEKWLQLERDREEMRLQLEREKEEMRLQMERERKEMRLQMERENDKGEIEQEQNRVASGDYRKRKR